MDTLENKETLAAAAEEAAQVNEQEVINPAAEQPVAEEEISAVDESPAIDEQPAAEEKNVSDEDAEQLRDKVVEDFRALLDQPADQLKERADQLKSQFYKLHHQLSAKLRQQQHELEADAEQNAEQLEQLRQTAQEKITDVENEFKQLLQQYKDKRAETLKQQQQQLEQNQLRKENIINQMKEMVESGTADVQENMKKFRELQAEWKTIGPVPPQVSTQLWKQYNLYQESFYDLVKINYELRDYDFKKNLEMKTELCEQAEKLQQSDNVVESFRALQQLHEKWADIGPVARELRDEIWNRFKEASTVINKRHQEHFEKIHKKEEENLQLKLDIMDQLKAIDTDQLTTNKQWDEATELVNSLQTKWRTIGFAPKKHNQLIYDEYRQLCDNFFASKTAFYRQLKDTLGENLQKKRSLLEKAEALKDSEDWESATEQFVKLQQEWKKVGPVARKYSEDIWKRFQSTCDAFFERKKEQHQSQRDVERQNLKLKQALIKQIEEIEIGERDETLSRLRELTDQYAEIGHVPFRDKEKVYRQFHAATDRIYDQLNVQASERRMSAFARSVEAKDDDQLQGDRRRLMRQYEALQQEIKVAENNIMFFTSKSGKGNKIVDDLQKKITDLKQQLVNIEQKINLIDEKLD